MKKLLFLVIALGFLFGCEKKESEDCNCGIVKVSQFQSWASPAGPQYQVTIQNNCSGNYGFFWYRSNQQTGKTICRTEEW